MRALSPIPALVATIAVAAAQDEANRRGTIADAKGHGVAATVHVRPVTGDGLGDLVTLDTAADGTFALPATIGERWLAFAATADAATPLVEWRGVGPLGTWRLEASSPTRIAVAGLDDWRAEGPLRAFVLLPTSYCWASQVDLDGRGNGRVPPLPAGDVMLELRTSTDEVLCREPLPRAAAVANVRLPAPLEITLRIVDRDDAPIAGADVQHVVDPRDDTRAAPLSIRHDPRARRLGRSGADGKLKARLPRRGASADAAFFGSIRCEHEKHEAVTRRSHELSCADGTGTVVLDEAQPFDVIVLRGGKPLAVHTVHLFTRTTEIAFPEVSVTPWDGTATTAADGRATFACVPADAGELRLVVDGVCVPLLHTSGQEVDISRVRDVALHVTDGARAVAGMQVIALAAPQNLQLLDPFGCEPRTVTDVTGRATLSLPGGMWWVFACDRDGFAHGIVDGDAACDLRWTRTPYATWRVSVTENGKPTPGARFEVLDVHWIEGTPIPARETLFPLQWLGQRNFVAAASGAADADGVLTVRWLPTGITGVRGHVVAPNGVRSKAVDLESATAPRAIELR